MVLKIDTNDGWVFVDDIYNLEVRTNCKKVVELGILSFRTRNGATYVADVVIDNVCGDGHDPCYSVVSCHRNNKDSITYAFDTVAFLLNDNGKTIERI